jgi:hypothetical protein
MNIYKHNVFPFNPQRKTEDKCSLLALAPYIGAQYLNATKFYCFKNIGGKGVTDKGPLPTIVHICIA